jgi:hypothetical protein
VTPTLSVFVLNTTPLVVTFKVHVGALLSTHLLDDNVNPVLQDLIVHRLVILFGSQLVASQVLTLAAFEQFASHDVFPAPLVVLPLEHAVQVAEFSAE